MTVNNTKWITLAVAFCFAILQALQPFIHGHLDAEHPIQQTGLHIGNEFEEVAVSQQFELTHSIAAPHASHTISVASGIKQDINSDLVLEMIGLVFALVATVVAIRVVRATYLSFDLSLYQSFRLTLPTSRAPPKN